MASSTSVASPPPPKPLDDDIDEGDESEYEEIEEEVEVEEEVEIEEEVEEEVDLEVDDEVDMEVETEEEAEVEADPVEGNGGNEIGEDLTPVRRVNHKNDTNHIMELEEHEDVAHGVYISNPRMDVPTMQKTIGVKPSKSSNNEELHATGEKNARDNNPKAPLNNSGEVYHGKTTPFTGDVNASSIMVGASSKKDNAILSVKAESNHTAIEAVGDQRQMAPRLHLPQMRSRDPSSSDEFNGENKKLRIVCEFHAKGWCIRGSSCRFLHLKDGSDAAVKRSEVLEKEASSSACIPPQQSWENPKLNSEADKLVLRKDDTFGSAPLLDDRRRFGLNFHSNNYSYYAAPLVKDNSTARNSSYHESFSVTSHDSHSNARISAFGTTMEEKKNDVMQSDPSSRDLLYSHPTQSVYFGSSSWNTNAHGTQNLWERGLECHASIPSSLQRSIPPVSHSISETLSLNHNSRDTGPANYKPVFSSFDWEPSAPFCPSHELTRKLLLKDKPYDPVRDSINAKDVKDGLKIISHSDQGSSVKDKNVQSDNQKEEENLLNSAHAGNSKEDNILTSTSDDKLKYDKARDEPLLEVGGVGKNDQVDVKTMEDNQMRNASTDFKTFQLALIEFVKELVKPTWREGFLSRDAHKLIVKKAVDKILVSIPHEQIPKTSESTDLYLSSSQTKIAKLVEAYVSKYGTSQNC